MMMKNGLCSTSREAFFLTNLKVASVTIYPNGFLSLFSLRGGWLGRVLASSRLAMFFGWLAGGFRVIAVCWRAAGVRTNRLPVGDCWGKGGRGAHRAELDDTKYSPFCRSFSACLLDALNGV